MRPNFQQYRASSGAPKSDALRGRQNRGDEWAAIQPVNQPFCDFLVTSRQSPSNNGYPPQVA